MLPVVGAGSPPHGVGRRCPLGVPLPLGGLRTSTIRPAVRDKNRPTVRDKNKARHAGSP